MEPRAEIVHWMFATGILLLGLCLAAEAAVGREVWNRRPWRAYLWPGLVFLMGVLMWPVMTLYTNSAIHMLAHGSWAEVLMIAGAAELGRVRGKLKSPVWRLGMAAAFLVSGLAFLLHEQNPWFFQRSAFLHHALGWALVAGTVFPLGQAFRPRSAVWATGFACSVLTVSVLLYCDRDLAPVFGHLSQLAGTPHR